MKRRMIVSLLIIVTVAVAGIVLNRSNSESVSAATGGPEVTVYNSNIALVKEVRSVDLETGVNRVRITDVPSQIDPTSLHFVSLTDPAHTIVLEQNYEYDLVNTLKVLRKYLDKEVRITTQDGSVYVGTLLSAEGDIILSNQDGGLTILKQDQIQKFELTELPEGLITRPTLEWLVRAAQEGTHQVELAYLTNGINWHANYVVLLAQDEQSLDLNGWVTVDNRSGGSFKDAKLKLVAGEIARVRPQPAVTREVLKTVEAPMPTPEVEERKFFEYHLYEVQRPVTLLNNQTKQIEFISQSDIPSVKRYILNLNPMAFRGGVITDPELSTTARGNPEVFVEFQTGEESGLDKPLPAGVVRLYKEDVDGAPLLIGETQIGHTPVGETVKLRVGRAFDIVGERKQTNFTKLGPRAMEETYSITIRNHKDEDVTIRVVEPLFRAAEWEIIKASHDYTKADAHTIFFDVEVPAKDKVTVTYTVRYRW